MQQKKNTEKNKVIYTFMGIAFWILIWQILSMVVGKQVLLASPLSVFKKLGELAVTLDFWKSIGLSLCRIGLGLLLGCVLGCILAPLAHRFRWLHYILSPLVKVMKTVPVASFIIVVLIWVSSKYLSVIIALIMVFPIMYTNISVGMSEMKPELMEMAKVFKLPFKTKLRYVYISQIMPFFMAGISLSIGLSWKAGIAAEVIGIPEGTIGEKLYNAKIYLNTPELFAWTLALVIVSILFEKIVFGFTKKWSK